MGIWCGVASGKEVKLHAPVALGAEHALDSFDCGQQALNLWLMRHARQAQASGSARSFVVADDTKAVAAYFSLAVGQVETMDAPERLRKGTGQYPVPVVILARLAVDTRYHSQGMGFAMLQDAIRRSVLVSEQAGVRALLTHPIDAQADAFYRHFGFETSPVRADQLLLLLKDARKFL